MSLGGTLQHVGGSKVPKNAALSPPKGQVHAVAPAEGLNAERVLANGARCRRDCRDDLVRAAVIGTARPSRVGLGLEKSSRAISSTAPSRPDPKTSFSFDRSCPEHFATDGTVALAMRPS